MYLSRVPLDLSKRKTQKALASPNLFHGAVEEAFSEKQKRNLWRIDTVQGKTYLLILSNEKPNLAYIVAQFGNVESLGETKEYDRLLARIEEGSVWRFRLVANPVRSVSQGAGRGKVTAHTTEKFQLEWLNRKAEKGGFHIVPDSVCITECGWKIFYKQKEKKRVRLLSVTFEGKLRVENVELFKNTLFQGIGREKAYGMGLLTIARIGG